MFNIRGLDPDEEITEKFIASQVLRLTHCSCGAPDKQRLAVVRAPNSGWRRGSIGTIYQVHNAVGSYYTVIERATRKVIFHKKLPKGIEPLTY